MSAFTSLPPMCPVCGSKKRRSYYYSDYTEFRYECGRATRELSDEPNVHKATALCKGNPN